MKANRVGRTRVEVTVLGFGGAQIGNHHVPIGDDTARGAIEAAWQGGIRYFDTAPHYGLGLSERRLGAALASRPREQYAISTKVGRLLVPNLAPTGSDLATGFAVPDDLIRECDYSRDGIRRSLDDSLERLGLDRIDIVYVHDPEEHMEIALTQAVPALIDLREQGVIGAVGVGMNYVDPLLQFATQTDVDVVMVAGRWTLLDRSAAKLLAACERRGISVVAAAPFNSGLSAKAWPSQDAHFDYGPAPAGVLAAARAAAELCDSYGITLPHAAMQYPLQRPAVAAVVAGMSSADQVTQNLSWATADLPPGLLDAITPAVGP
jgi:Predicted oxidoreductases (related to aryl-alcohol dehydrogenases)